MIEALRARLGALHDNHKRIASGALAMGMMTLGAKLFVAAREIAIAWRYGVSATVDSYQLAITMTTWLPMLINGVMTVVLVPRLVTIGRGHEDRGRFIEEFNGSVVLLAIFVSVLTWAVAPVAASLLAGDHPEIRRMTAVIGSRISPIAACIIVCGYLSVRLQSRERFTYSLTEAVPALAIASTLLLSLGLAGAVPLIVGTLVGYLLQVLVLGWMTERKDPPLGLLSIRHSSPQWRTFYGALGMMAIGQLLITLANPIDQAFAARIGAGAVATLGFANRIIGLLTGFGAVVVARALLPVLSGEAAGGNRGLGQRHTLQWSLLMGVAAALGAALLWLIAPLIVRLLFQRGAFDAIASANVAHVLRFGLLQLPFYFAGIALVQWYAATSRYRAIFAITTSALVVKVGLNAILAPRLGVAGIALATAAMYCLTTSLLAAGLFKRAGGLGSALSA